jgi:hypothetical protein
VDPRAGLDGLEKFRPSRDSISWLNNANHANLPKAVEIFNQ